MATSTLDALFTLWKSIHTALVAGALGVAPTIALPLFLWAYREHAHGTVRAVAGTGLVWAAVVLLVSVPAFAVRTSPTYDFGLAGLLFIAISLLASIVALVSIAALSWKLEATWPIVVGVALVPLVFGSMKLKRAAHEWEDGGRSLRDGRDPMSRWLDAHPLHRAIVEGDAARAERLAASSPREELIAMAPGGATALHLAAEAGQLRTAELLIDRGADVDLAVWPEPEAAPLVPVNLAIARERWDVVGLLLRRGAIVRGDAGTSLLVSRPDLFVAADLPPDAVQAALVGLVRRPGLSATEAAAALDALARCKFDPNAPVPHHLADAPETPLGHAIDAFWRGRDRDALRHVRWLLARGADPNLGVRGRGTPGAAPLRALLAPAGDSDEMRLAVEPQLDAVDALVNGGARVDDGEPCPLGALLVTGFRASLDAGTLEIEAARSGAADEPGRRRLLAQRHGAWGTRFGATLRRFAANGARFGGRGCDGGQPDLARAEEEIEEFLPRAERADLRAIVLGRR